MALAGCQAKEELSITHNLEEIRWYEAKNNYNRILRQSYEAERNDINCEQKLDSCDKDMKSAVYYPKALADANARLKTAEMHLYNKIKLQIDSDNNKN